MTNLTREQADKVRDSMANATHTQIEAVVAALAALGQDKFSTHGQVAGRFHAYLTR